MSKLVASKVCALDSVTMMALALKNVISVISAPISATVTLQVAFLPDPSAAVAVIVAVPAFTPFTTPFALTVAILLLLVVQTTLLLLGFFGLKAAFKVSLPPISMLAFVLLSFTLVTGVPTVTAIVTFFFLSALDVIVTLAVPAFFAATTTLEPETFAVAIFLFEDFAVNLVDTDFFETATFTFSLADLPFAKVSVLAGRLLTVTLVTFPLDAADTVVGAAVRSEVTANAAARPKETILVIVFFIYFFPFHFIEQTITHC